MKRLARLITTVVSVIALGMGSSGFVDLVRPAVAAADTPPAIDHVIINEVKLGGSSDPAIPTEYVTLFNPTGGIISLDGWKLEYVKAGATITCQNSSWGVAASQVTELSGTLAPDQLSAPIARSFTDAKDGSVHLVDGNGTVQDLVGWGTTAPCSETSPAQTPANGQSIQRLLSCSASLPVDSGNNANDFGAPAQPNPTGLSGQYVTNCSSSGSTGQSGDDNSDGTTDTGSSGSGTTPTCEGVILNEILPNPSGTDTGHEFIELYNPTSQAISLDGCSLQTSSNSKVYSFSGTTLQPNQYQAFYDSQTGLTLPNSAGGTVWLLSPTTELQAIDYPANLDDDVAWARFGNAWQATYTLTPNAANVLLATAPCPANQSRDAATGRCRDIVSAATLVPCKPNQVRNPQTNRCRSILAGGATLTPCKPGQIRNPDTNRCKSITASSSSLKPCKSGQERNPATNRCKSVLAASTTLKPCAAGQVRNPATNRCRKDTAANLANVQDVKAASSTSASHWQWFIGAAVIIGAIGYAFYEWRHDIALFIDKLKSKLPILRHAKQSTK